MIFLFPWTGSLQRVQANTVDTNNTYFKSLKGNI